MLKLTEIFANNTIDAEWIRDGDLTSPKLFLLINVSSANKEIARNILLTEEQANELATFIQRKECESV